MSLSPRSLIATTVFAVALLAAGLSIADATGQRQRSAHVHGTGLLNLALAGRALYLELQSPAADLVGFEHAPSSAADRDALAQVLAALQDGDGLFRFNGDASCAMEDVKITSELLEEGAGDEGEADGEVHAEFEAFYLFFCRDAEDLRELSVGLFERFPGSRRLLVQFVVGGRQGTAALTADAQVLRF
jgi:hypothetical protein